MVQIHGVFLFSCLYISLFVSLFIKIIYYSITQELPSWHKTTTKWSSLKTCCARQGSRTVWIHMGTSLSGPQIVIRARTLLMQPCSTAQCSGSSSILMGICWFAGFALAQFTTWNTKQPGTSLNISSYLASKSLGTPQSDKDPLLKITFFSPGWVHPASFKEVEVTNRSHSSEKYYCIGQNKSRSHIIIYNIYIIIYI